MYLQQDLDVPSYDEFKNEIEQRFQQAKYKNSNIILSSTNKQYISQKNFQVSQPIYEAPRASVYPRTAQQPLYPQRQPQSMSPIFSSPKSSLYKPSIYSSNKDLYQYLSPRERIEKQNHIFNNILENDRAEQQNIQHYINVLSPREKQEKEFKNDHLNLDLERFKVKQEIQVSRVSVIPDQKIALPKLLLQTEPNAIKRKEFSPNIKVLQENIKVSQVFQNVNNDEDDWETVKEKLNQQYQIQLNKIREEALKQERELTQMHEELLEKTKLLMDQKNLKKQQFSSPIQSPRVQQIFVNNPVKNSQPLTLRQIHQEFQEILNKGRAQSVSIYIIDILERLNLIPQNQNEKALQQLKNSQFNCFVQSNSKINENNLPYEDIQKNLFQTICSILGVPVAQRGYRQLDDRFLKLCLSKIQNLNDKKDFQTDQLQCIHDLINLTQYSLNQKQQNDIFSKFINLRTHSSQQILSDENTHYQKQEILNKKNFNEQQFLQKQPLWFKGYQNEEIRMSSKTEQKNEQKFIQSSIITGVYQQQPIQSSIGMPASIDSKRNFRKKVQEENKNMPIHEQANIETPQSPEIKKIDKDQNKVAENRGQSPNRQQISKGSPQNQAVIQIQKNDSKFSTPTNNSKKQNNGNIDQLTASEIQQLQSIFKASENLISAEDFKSAIQKNIPNFQEEKISNLIKSANIDQQGKINVKDLFKSQQSE